MSFPQLLQFNDLGLFLLRLAVGLIFLAHGTQKLETWEMKPAQMPSYLFNMMKFLSTIEPLAGMALILGISTQLAAAALSLVMMGALYHKIVIWKKKLTEPGGWELDLVLFAANLTILFSGGGSIAIL